jgi:hypothetical protein
LTFTADTAGAAGNSITVEYLDSVKASLVVGDVTFTADAKGSGGNAISVALAGTGFGSQEAATAVGNAITVAIQGSDTFAVKTCNGGQSASKVIQDLTFAADTRGTAGNSITVAYVAAAKATGTVTITDHESLIEGTADSVTVGTIEFTAQVGASTPGATTFTANGVLYGNTASAVGVTAAGTTGQVLVATTSAAPTWGSSIVTDTVKSATGTAVNFTGIPSWVKRVTIMFRDLSTNGTSAPIVQLGHILVVTSGYLGACSNAGGVASNFSSGFIFAVNHTAANILHGTMTIENISGNNWVETSIIGLSEAAGVRLGAGSTSILSTLQSIRVTTTNGSDSFDGGTINISYE